MNELSTSKGIEPFFYSDQSNLVVETLSCTRGERQLFVGLEFSLRAGEILQVKGHNGCGKTSLLRIIAGLVQAESGQTLWNGDSVCQSESYFSNMQYLGHQTGIKVELTALENLQFSRDLKNTNQQDLFVILDSLGLRGFEDIPCGNLSAGQKRRVGLARLFVSDCQLWILDEPFTALDVVGIDKLEQACLEHLQNNGMIIITTHQPLQKLKDRYKSLNPLDFCQEL